MQKYLHTFKYHHEDSILYKLELKYVFKKDNFEDRTFMSDKIEVLENTCFGEIVLEIMAYAEKFNDLKEQLVKLPIFDDAKLDSLSIGFQPKCGFHDAMKLLPYLKFHANMKNPANVFFLTRNKEGWYFGKKVSESKKLWNIHRSKPLTMSSAIPHLLARTLIGMLKHSGNNSIIDYCCGSGTFLIEACSYGMKTSGIDLNENMINMTQANLNHFNYKSNLSTQDAATFDETADCGIVDFPYGYHCQRDEDAEVAIIKNVMEHVSTGVFICGSNSDELFSNYQILEYVKIPAVTVTRHIYFCSKK